MTHRLHVESSCCYWDDGYKFPTLVTIFVKSFGNIYRRNVLPKIEFYYLMLISHTTPTYREVFLLSKSVIIARAPLCIKGCRMGTQATNEQAVANLQIRCGLLPRTPLIL